MANTSSAAVAIASSPACSRLMRLVSTTRNLLLPNPSRCPQKTALHVGCHAETARFVAPQPRTTAREKARYRLLHPEEHQPRSQTGPPRTAEIGDKSMKKRTCMQFIVD